MPSIHERNASLPKRMIIRIAVAMGFILAAYLYAAHVQSRVLARATAADHVLALVRASKDSEALAAAVTAEQELGTSAELSRAVWTALMAGGGKHGQKALLRRSYAYVPHDPAFSMMFSTDDRFLAAIDGNQITVWNVEDGPHVLTASAGDRFIGYWRIGARHFGLLASYQFLDLVNSVIELPDGFKYAQPAKDQLSGVAPGGDWGYYLPKYAPQRSDYPVKLVNLHTSEKREVDFGYGGHVEGWRFQPVGLNADATRIATAMPIADAEKIDLWDARSRNHLATQYRSDMISGLYFSASLGTLISIPVSGARTSVQKVTGLSEMSPTTKDVFQYFDKDDGAFLFSIPAISGAISIADDPKGFWFAIAAGGKIQVYRGANAPGVSAIAESEVSRAPATSR